MQKREAIIDKDGVGEIDPEEGDVHIMDVEEEEASEEQDVEEGSVEIHTEQDATDAFMTVQNNGHTGERIYTITKSK